MNTGYVTHVAGSMHIPTRRPPGSPQRRATTPDPQVGPRQLPQPNHAPTPPRARSLQPGVAPRPQSRPTSHCSPPPPPAAGPRPDGGCGGGTSLPHSSAPSAAPLPSARRRSNVGGAHTHRSPPTPARRDPTRQTQPDPRVRLVAGRSQAPPPPPPRMPAHACWHRRSRPRPPLWGRVLPVPSHAPRRRPRPDAGNPPPSRRPPPRAPGNRGRGWAPAPRRH